MKIRLSPAMEKAVKRIQAEAEKIESFTSKKITEKVTKNKTLKAVFLIPRQPHFNLFVNDKLYATYLFNGKDWKKG